MTKWNRYKKEANSSLQNQSEIAKEQRSHDRMQKQLDTALDIWAFSQPNSLIRLAKFYRELYSMSGETISYEDSIEMAKEKSKGRLQ